jgi:hypothetical protein
MAQITRCNNVLMVRFRRLRITMIFLLLNSIISIPNANAITTAEATTLLNNCIAAINDPLYTRSTLPGIMGFASATAIENAIAAGSLGVYIANGSGVIPNSGSSNGNAQDIFCGDSNDNQVANLDSDASSQDFFFGGAGNDSLTGTMWYSKFYGGPGNDYANSIQERSTFSGGPGTDTYTTLSVDSTFDQGVDDTTAPTFTSSSSFSVAENIVTTFNAATITVSESATVTISAGADAALFNIVTSDSVTAFIRFNTSPNFEVPTDAGSNNVYDITVRAVDAAANAGTQAITISVTDVVETSSFNSLALTGNATTATYRQAVTITANVTVASKVTFRAKNVIISGCKNKLTSGSSPNIIATCSWKPSTRGNVRITATAAPTTAGISGATATPVNVNVVNRGGSR